MVVVVDGDVFLYCGFPLLLFAVTESASVLEHFQPRGSCTSNAVVVVAVIIVSVLHTSWDIRPLPLQD